MTDPIRQTAGMLQDARAPLLLADAIDLAAAAACVRLAKRAGARLDHTHRCHLTASQEQGIHLTSLGEASVRADQLLFVGDFSKSDGDDEGLARLLQPKAGRIYTHIGPASRVPGHADLARYETSNDELHATLGALCAIANGNRVAPQSSVAKWGPDLVERLEKATYGVAVIAAEHISDLSQHALMRLVDTLAAKTRWTILIVAVPNGQNELIRMCQAMSGLPPPLAFRAGRGVHDPVLGDAHGLVERGDVDTVMWITSSPTSAPAWLNGVEKLIAVSPASAVRPAGSLHVPVGIAGVDHASILEPPELGAFVGFSPAKPGILPSAAHVLHAIAGQITSAQEEAPAWA